MCIIVLNFYVCQARQRPVTRAASVRHARETPVVEKIRSRPVVETAVAAALGWNDPSPLPACSHCDKKKLKTFGLMIAIENVLAAVDAAGVRSPVQTADTTDHWEVVSLLESVGEHSNKSYRCTTTNDLTVVAAVWGKIRRGNGRHDCSRGVVPRLRPQHQFPIK